MSGSNSTSIRASVPNGIILFWYHASPYGRRVKSYLTLRRIDHAECIQPPILPRPDISALGVNYRRSPVMAIGRDVYLDTRLIIAKLEELFPASETNPGLSSPESEGLAQLLQKLSTETMFRETVKQIPPSPLFKDPKFQKDRAGFFGPEWQTQDPRLTRPEGITHMRQCFDILESLFADGRQWVAGTKQLSLADLEGVWIPDWLIGDLRPAKEFFSEQQYPKVFEWRRRYREQLDAAKANTKRSVSIKGSDAQSFIGSSAFSDKHVVVDVSDPLQLAGGTMVDLFPTDGGGYTHQDKGRLVKLNKTEVAIAVQSSAGQEVRVHAPRWNFRIRALDGSARL